MSAFYTTDLQFPCSRGFNVVSFSKLEKQATSLFEKCPCRSFTFCIYYNFAQSLCLFSNIYLLAGLGDLQLCMEAVSTLLPNIVFSPFFEVHFHSCIISGVCVFR